MVHTTDGSEAAERDLEAYKLLLELWSNENPIKTNKLQVLLAVNAILVSAVSLSSDFFTFRLWYLYAAGVFFNLVWTLSLGRTALFQRLWDLKLERLRLEHADDPRFSVRHVPPALRKEAPRLLRWLGGVSSKWYVLASPVVLALVWMLILAVAYVGR